MFPLIRLTWTINRRFLVNFSPILALYLAAMLKAQTISAVMPRPFLMCLLGITGLITLIITFPGLTLEVEGFLLSLPVTRAQVVQAKYLTCLLGLLAGLALPLGTAWAGHALLPGRLPAPSHEILRTVGLATLLWASGIFLFLPFIHHFGASKGFMGFALTVILLPSAGLAWKGLDGADAVIKFLDRILAQPSLAMGLTAGVVGFGVASLNLSIWSYRRRAF